MNDDRAQQFLRASAQRAGLGALGYPELVAARLEHGRSRWGERFLDWPLERLAREIREEGLDLGGWGVGAFLSVDLAGRPADEQMRIGLLLQAIAAHGAHVEFHVRELLDMLQP